jgi:hypothetical protein
LIALGRPVKPFRQRDQSLHDEITLTQNLLSSNDDIYERLSSNLVRLLPVDFS